MAPRSHEEHEENLGAYVLGALPELEATAFERHMMGCSECRDEVVHLSVAADALPRAVPQLTPSPELKRELMSAVGLEAGGARRARSVVLGSRTKLLQLRPALAWISAAFLLGVGVFAGYGVFSITDGSDPAARSVAGRVDQARSPGGSASLVLPKTGDASLRVENMPALGPGSIYEVWYRRGDKVEPAGTFSVTSDGRGVAALPDGLDGVHEVMVTRERAPGAERPRPGGPLVVVETS